MTTTASTTGTTVTVDAILAGEARAPRAYVYRPAGKSRLGRVLAVLRPDHESLTTPLLWFAVRHPSAGTILVDTGLHPDAAADVRADYGRFLGGVFRSLRPAEQTFEEQLRQRGIAPGDVDLVVMTHLHVDHTGGMRLLPNAEFVCSSREWEAATGRRAVLNGYVSNHLPSASRMRQIDFDRDAEPFGPFTQAVDLLGDGSVRLLFTPGHTHGHCSVLLRLRQGREVLLVGDAAYTLRSVSEQLLPAFTADDELSRRSLRELKAYADERPEATLVPTHDPDAWRAVAP